MEDQHGGLLEKFIRNEKTSKAWALICLLAFTAIAVAVLYTAKEMKSDVQVIGSNDDNSQLIHQKDSLLNVVAQQQATIDQQAKQLNHKPDPPPLSTDYVNITVHYNPAVTAETTVDKLRDLLMSQLPGSNVVKDPVTYGLKPFIQFFSPDDDVTANAILNTLKENFNNKFPYGFNLKTDTGQAAGNFEIFLDGTY